MKTMQELKDEDIPHAQFDDYFTQDDPNDVGQKKTKEYIQKYLKIFVSSKQCICCGTIQGGMFGAMLGGFQYGIVFGEGECGTCGYPARAYHEIQDEQGKIIITINPLLLQYHPSVLNLPQAIETTEQTQAV